MAETMKDVTRVMRRMNASMKLPQLQKIMMEFEKQSGLLESKEEMMSDAIDDALGDDDIDESETIVNKVTKTPLFSMGLLCSILMQFNPGFDPAAHVCETLRFIHRSTSCWLSCLM